MAHKIYHIPLQQTLAFIKSNKADIVKLTQDKNFLQYHKHLGKAFYMVELNKFMHFFKIDKDIKYALATIEFFNSVKFVDTVYTHLELKQFEIDKNILNKKDFFYAFCNILQKQDEKLFIFFLEKLFLHYHKSFGVATDINIDFKNIALDIAKQKNIKVKESFGEDKNGSYFKIVADDKIIINIKGKSIKTLRKKAYKKFFEFVLDCEQTKTQNANIYDELHDLRMM
jgi:hypothetical protein